MSFFLYFNRVNHDPAYQPSRRDDIITVGFPGFLAARAQLAKYTADEPVIVLSKGDKKLIKDKKKKKVMKEKKEKDFLNQSNKNKDEFVDYNTVEDNENNKNCSRNVTENDNGETDDEYFDIEKIEYISTSCYAPRIVHNLFPYYDVDENETGWTFNPIYLTLKLKSIILRKYMRITNMPAIHNVLSLNNLGGFVDQQACRKQIERAIEYLKKTCSFDKKKLVLFGFSRGATTVMYTALRLPEELAKHVSLVVLEAPFDTIKGVFSETFLLWKLYFYLFKKFCNYSGDEAYLMPKTTFIKCPFVFITSEVDRRVPKKTTMRCIKAIKQNFPQIKIEHLELKKSPHPTMTFNNDNDVNDYVTFMDRCYNTYLGVSNERNYDVENSVLKKEMKI